MVAHSDGEVPSSSIRTSRRTIGVETLDAERSSRAKRAFTTRRVPLEAMATLVQGSVRPRSGDLVLARVDRLGHHTKLELTSGRRATMHPGDEIVLTYADRYAPDQFEAQVPMSLAPTHLVASGGIASEMLSRSSDTRRPTEITPIGLIGDGRGVPLNIDEFALGPCEPSDDRPPTIAVIGTSMNSGKTTTVHGLVHSLAQAGHLPGATKVTGTGSGNDFWVMLDGGAHMMLDFTDVGMASTYRVDMALVERRAVRLMDHLAAGGCGAVVVEVADGIFQKETAQLLTSQAFRSRVDGVMFAAADALGAVGGLERLRALDLPVLAVSGRFTKSPLAMREAEGCCDLPVYSLEHLADPALVSSLFGLPAVAGACVDDDAEFRTPTLVRPPALGATIAAATIAAAENARSLGVAQPAAGLAEHPA